MSSREAAPPQIDHVIGVFSRDVLSAALAATHRAGFGPQTRVFDGERAATPQQLERAGLVVQGDRQPPPTALLIVVTAPGRVTAVAGLFEELGAESVLLASRGTAATPHALRARPMLPDIRIDDQAGASAEP